jgi:tetratricopeptide (TPR) repeat protein
LIKKKARVWRERLVIPTYEMGEEERLPIFYKLRINQGTKGAIYPYKSNDKLIMKKNENHEYDAICLENDYIKVTVLPELGGRIYEGYDKINKYNFVYKNNVIKPALIGLNGAWVSGGIEFNWPQHHRPTTFMPVEATIEEETDGSVTAWLGETEAMNGLKSLLGVNIHPDKAYITAKVKLYNPTPQPQTFHWWANLAVHTNESYRLMFPPDIDYITFHDRTHVSPFPIVKGIFAGHDYGDGVDIRKYANLAPASSFFIFDSQYSFMAGYDDSKEMGTVHVADRYLSPGKKFFTWGTAGYGNAWQKNLTDEDGEYLEIMTGCFTDNQPDFTWIMPYETKTFEQRWYSLKGLPDLKNATEDAAISIIKDGDKIKVSFNVTHAHEVTLDVNGAISKYNAVPGEVYEYITEEIECVDNVVVKLTDESGKELVSWQKLPMFFDGKEVPQPRKKPTPPEQIESIDELWINGMHIEQYKHATMLPDPYYLEALKRDPLDIRCNTSMAKLMYRRGRFHEAIPYLKNALERAISRNPNPYNPECYYQLGLVYKHLGNNKEALDCLKRAAWSYAWKSAALLQSAEIEIAQGDYETALDDLNASLDTNRNSLRALALKSAVLLRLGRKDEAKQIAIDTNQWDRLDSAPYFTMMLCGDKEAGEQLVSILGNKVGSYIDLAEIYLSSELYDEGIKALLLCKHHTALTAFYLAYATNGLGSYEESQSWLKKAEELPLDSVFPNRTFDFKVLEYATISSNSAIAPYYLGCMLYARDTEEEAAKYWQLSVKRNPDFADAHRALAQAMFETFGDKRTAKEEITKAFELSKEPRILYEMYQLYKVLGTESEALLALLKENMEIAKKRQDLILQYIELLNKTGRLEEAKQMLDQGSFYTYEGGEGLVPQMHAFTYIALGIKALKEGDPQKALTLFKEANEYPERYHEGKKHQQRDAHRHYFIAKGYEAIGNMTEYKKELEIAIQQYDDLSESQYFKGMAMRELGDYVGAAKLFLNMKSAAEDILNSETLDYFLGFPAALPFEQSQRRTIEKMGLSALFYGQLGLGEYEAAKETATKIHKGGFRSLWIDLLLEDLNI